MKTIKHTFNREVKVNSVEHLYRLSTEEYDEQSIKVLYHISDKFSDEFSYSNIEEFIEHQNGNIPEIFKSDNITELFKASNTDIIFTYQETKEVTFTHSLLTDNDDFRSIMYGKPLSLLEKLEAKRNGDFGYEELFYSFEEDIFYSTESGVILDIENSHFVKHVDVLYKRIENIKRKEKINNVIKAV